MRKLAASAGLALVLCSAAWAGSAPVESTTPSVTVDDQIHLGASTSLFKDGAVFLWNDGAGGNTGLGYSSLSSTTTGTFNTAVGRTTLVRNIDGDKNTGIGDSALYFNLGDGNTAVGSNGMYYNVDGSYNTAVGRGALYKNDEGNRSTGIGTGALNQNTSGSNNAALGDRALSNNTTGSRNIGLGYKAGFNATDGDDNVFIANQGVAGDASLIRIGTSGTHTKAYFAGVRGVGTGVADAVTMYIDSAGQLGTASSSRRYKEDVEDMADVSERLRGLRPVTFRYRQEFSDGEKPIQFGLIAEEVAEVFPELVVYDDEGRPETVKYHLLSSLLLNELQKQANALEEQAQILSELRDVKARLVRLEALRPWPSRVAGVADRERSSP